MALSTLLPSSSSNDGDHSGRRRQHHRGKHKQKPVPPQRSSPPRPRTPPASHSAAAAMSKKPKNPKPARGKNAATAASAPPPAVSSSREQLKGLLSCRSASAAARVQDPAAPSAFARLRSSGGACGASLCAVRDVVDAASSAASSTATVSVDRDTAALARSSRRAHRAPPRGGGQPSLRGLSGCYECRAINVEPMSRRYPRAREVCACPQCGEVFTKAESLEHHQAIRHAVSELGPEDSGRNIVEIIFKSSWRNSDRPICQVERILKVHNAPRTVARFEAYRDAVTSRCRAACAARAAADGNELLRFHSAPLACPLGLPGSTSLCPATDPNQGHACGVCTAVKHGFAPWLGAHPLGVRTTASSGRAHDCGATPTDSMGRHAMLVCRVIAGRVRRAGDATEEPFDSVAGEEDSDGGPCGNLEELFVANPMAILPCFVVVYRTVD